MACEQLRRRSLIGIALAVGLGSLHGCVSRGAAVREWLDEASGVTVAGAAEPAVFARAELRYSRSERDYVYIGPVETNRRGTREHYLWVGVATTLDRGFLAPPAVTPEKLYIAVRGEWMELELRPWREREPALVTPVYRPRVKLTDELAARMTADQLALLEAEPPRTIKLAAGDAALREFARWDDPSVWPTLKVPVLRFR